MTISSLLGGMSPEQFLRDYWQKKPLLIRQAIPGYQSPITPNELAGLSLEEDIESRLILEHGSHPWELRRGPMAEDAFQDLPERDWTLLIQAVDQIVPELSELMREFSFLPHWRKDDLMISYAVPGGSVGPHYDNYDVFLLQAEGHRRWKLGQRCDDHSPLLEHPDLRILQDFEQTDEWVLEPGDMLYIPPGIAHWGIAEDHCMTFSVGFRAPSHAEILLHYTDYASQQLGDSQRYSDADATPCDDPSRIDEASIDRLQAILRPLLEDREALAAWFGRHMTEARYPELLNPAEIDPQDLLQHLQSGGALLRHPSARLAWHLGNSNLKLFASGEHCVLPTSLLPLVQLVCNEDWLDADRLLPWQADPQAMTLLVQLLGKGDLLMESEDDEGCAD